MSKGVPLARLSLLFPLFTASLSSGDEGPPFCPLSPPPPPRLLLQPPTPPSPSSSLPVPHRSTLRCNSSCGICKRACKRECWLFTISNVHLRDAEFSRLNFSRRSLDRKMLANLLTKNSTQSVSASTRAFRTAA